MNDSDAECVQIIVGRQLQRGFGLTRESQTELVRQRIAPYAALEQVKVFCSLPPAQMAAQAASLLQAFWSSSVA